MKSVVELGCDLLTQDKEIRLHRYIRDWNIVLFCLFDSFFSFEIESLVAQGSLKLTM